ncbi:MAG: thermonuclease family protein, partial [Thermomicrobiales bacterium]
MFVALSLMFGSFAGNSSAQELPVGVPNGAVKATVTGFIDGDSIKVSLNRQGTVVELAGLDAPDSGECVGEEAAQRLKSLIPKPTTVYLQESGVADGKEVTRFVWVLGKEGGKAYLLNTKLVREGYAGVSDVHAINRYGDRIEDSELDAKEAGKGLWGKCEGLHQLLPPPPTPSPIPTPMPTPIPTPTPVPEPIGYTEEEQAYAGDVVGITDYLSDSFGEFSSLMGDLGDDPYL